MQIVKNEVSKRTNNNDIELETALQELVFYLLCDRIKTNVGRRTDLFNCRGHDTGKDGGIGHDDGRGTRKLNEKQRSG